MEYENTLLKNRNFIYEPDAVPTDENEKSDENIRIYSIKDEAEKTDTPLPFKVEKVKIHRERTDKTTAIAVIIVILSAVAGFALCGSFFNAADPSYINSYLKVRINGAFFENAVSSFFSMLIWLIMPFVCGFCAIGRPFTMLSLIVKGVGIGITLSSFLSCYSFNGILAFAAFILPSAVPGSAVAIYLSCQSLKSSYRLLCYTKGKCTDARPESYYGSFAGKALVCTVGCFIIGIFDALITLLLSDLFII